MRFNRNAKRVPCSSEKSNAVSYILAAIIEKFNLDSR